MAAITTAILGGLALANSVVQQQEAKKQNRKAYKEQVKVQNEQKAQNQAAQLAERRNQIREERVKRARILQGAQNTGTTGSSGEAGAVGSLSSQLSANLGANQSAIISGANQSLFSQNAALFSNKANEAEQLGQFGSQLASAYGNLAPNVQSLFK